VIRSGSTEFRYHREDQPLPKIGRWRDALDQLLLTKDAKARERLTLIRMFEELRDCSYDRRSPTLGFCHSRMLFVRAYPRETQEMVFVVNMDVDIVARRRQIVEMIGPSGSVSSAPRRRVLKELQTPVALAKCLNGWRCPGNGLEGAGPVGGESPRS
jgi:hypothetical protein